MRGIFRSSWSLALSPFLVSALTACGGGGGGGGKQQGNEQHDINLEVNPEQYEITCRDQESCLPYAGALLSYYQGEQEGQYGTTRCTFFLIEPDVIATNDHCLIDGPSPLANSYVRFPASGPYPDETVRVKGLISRSNDHQKDVGLDFAYIRLSRKVDRPPVPVKREPFVEDYYGVLRSTGVDPATPHKLELQLLHCRTLKKSVLFNNGMTFKPNDQIVILTECPVIKGDSGSAILNISRSEFTVIGQINKEGGIKQIIKEYPNLADESAFDYSNELGLGNNYLCVPPHTKSPKTKMPQCRKSKGSGFQLTESIILKGVMDSMTQLQEKLNEGRDDLKFTFMHSSEDQLKTIKAEVIPYCFNEEWAKNLEVNGISSEFHVQLTDYVFKPAFNEDLYPAVTIVKQDTRDSRIIAVKPYKKSLQVSLDGELKYLSLPCR